jgi:hypothetical protein
MITDVHARIQQFLQQQTIEPLLGEVAPFADQQYMKAGVIPFVRVGEGFEYLMMKPAGRNIVHNPPAMQICKGTRMYLHRGTGWRDMRPGDEPVRDKESLPVTAIREAIEEVGLKLDLIVRMQDVGPYRFFSEKTGKGKYMWLYTTELADKSHVLPDADVAASTAERGWLTLDAFTASGRDDHRYILKDIDAKLKNHYTTPLSS